MIGIRDSNVKMVTNGLKILYDASQLRSYPKTGTTWSDLSGNGDTGTLTNGPTFNSSNGGSIVFDRTDDYVTSTSQSNINFSPTNGYTIGSWVYPEFNSTDFNDQFSSYIAGRGSPTVSGDFHFVLMLSWAAFGMGQVRGVAFGYDGFNSFGYIATTNRWTNNAWNYIVVTHLSNVVKFYVNGTNIGSISNIGSYDRNNSGHRYIISHTTNTGGKYRGRVAISHAYNRVLSDAEVLLNFNAQKSRFGL